MLVVSILKRGRGFSEENEILLSMGLGDYDHVCVTDILKIDGIKTVPMKNQWPRWWSKMNLFDPDHPVIGDQDILYIDIDSLVCGDITPLMKNNNFTALTDFYYGNETDKPMASGVMFIPTDCKHIVWDRWIRNPSYYMTRDMPLAKRGDQGFIGECFDLAGIKVKRWQDILPNYVISYKKDVACEGMLGYHNRRSKGNGKIPEGTRVVCFHGLPRPWEINLNDLF